jgi:hypothetical protein
MANVTYNALSVSNAHICKKTAEWLNRQAVLCAKLAERELAEFGQALQCYTNRVLNNGRSVLATVGMELK